MIKTATRLCFFWAIFLFLYPTVTYSKSCSDIKLINDIKNIFTCQSSAGLGTCVGVGALVAGRVISPKMQRLYDLENEFNRLIKQESDIAELVLEHQNSTKRQQDITVNNIGDQEKLIAKTTDELARASKDLAVDIPQLISNEIVTLQNESNEISKALDQLIGSEKYQNAIRYNDLKKQLVGLRGAAFHQIMLGGKDNENKAEVEALNRRAQEIEADMKKIAPDGSFADEGFEIEKKLRDEKTLRDKKHKELMGQLSKYHRKYGSPQLLSLDEFKPKGLEGYDNRLGGNKSSEFSDRRKELISFLKNSPVNLGTPIEERLAKLEDLSRRVSSQESTRAILKRQTSFVGERLYDGDSAHLKEARIKAKELEAARYAFHEKLGLSKQPVDISYPIGGQDSAESKALKNLKKKLVILRPIAPKFVASPKAKLAAKFGKKVVSLAFSGAVGVAVTALDAILSVPSTGCSGRYDDFMNVSPPDCRRINPEIDYRVIKFLNLPEKEQLEMLVDPNNPELCDFYTALHEGLTKPVSFSKYQCFGNRSYSTEIEYEGKPYSLKLETDRNGNAKDLTIKQEDREIGIFYFVNTRNESEHVYKVKIPGTALTYGEEHMDEASKHYLGKEALKILGQFKLFHHEISDCCQEYSNSCTTNFGESSKSSEQKTKSIKK